MSVNAVGKRRSVVACWALSMFEYSSIRLMQRISLARFFGSAAAFSLAFFILANSSLASGCTHLTGGLGSDTPPGIAKIYEDGRFYYYKVVPPCNGPNCGRSDSTSLVSHAPAITNERIESLVGDQVGHFGGFQDESSFFLEFPSGYRSPLLDEPLRPPV